MRVFTPNEKQTLIVENVVTSLYDIAKFRTNLIVDCDDQFLLYVGGCRGTGKTQIINAILFASDLLNVRDKCCVTASIGTATSHIKGNTVHSAVGITGQNKSSISPSKLSTLQNVL
jgi:hypothetical protein